ncbi:MAG: YhdP family protein [Gammaproteobacteria bacterium]|nr:YhdP family protein [Gammaproteobacteria bacterium]
MALIRSLLGKLWLAGAGALVLLAVLLSIVRVLLPHVDGWKEDIEQRVGDAIGREIAIGIIAADWRGLNPRLVLEDVRIVSGDDDDGVHFERAELEMDSWRSLLHRSIHLRRLDLTGLRFTAVRDSAGHVSIAGFNRQMSGEATAGALPPLRGRFRLRDMQVRWIDHAHPAGPREHLFTDGDFSLHSDGERHQMDGEFSPPVILGQRIHLMADLRAPVSGRPEASIFAEGVGLHLAEWLDGRAAGGLRLAGGVAEGRIWAEWREGALLDVAGRLTLAQMAIVPVSSADPAPLASDLSASFHWRRADGGWRLYADRVGLGADHEVRGERRLALGMGIAGAEPDALIGRLKGFALEDVLALALASGRVPETVVKAIEGMRPQGELDDLGFAVAPGEGGSRYRVSAAFADVSASPWAGAPGVSGIAGALHMDERSGRLEMDSSESAATFDGLFRDSLPAARMRASLSWEKIPEGWRVRAPVFGFASADVAFDAWGRLDMTADARPALALFARFQASTVERISRYLPAGIMSDGLVGWLDRSILAGVVPSGELIVHGEPEDFPFEDGTGTFRIEFDVRDGVLEYAPEWPRIDGIDAHFAFRGKTMRIDAGKGATHGAQIASARVAIDDLTAHPAVLTVRGEASAPTADALSFLRDTPLAERFGAYVERVEAQGRTSLDLDLRLPLGGHAQVQGTVTLADSMLRLGPDGVEISGIDGALRFSEAGLSGQGIRGRVLDLPATFNVSARGEDAARITRVEARGGIDADGLSGLLRLPRAWFEGRAGWRAWVDVPAVAPDGSGMELRVVSTLEGLALTLPEPLNKPAARTLAASVRMPLDDDAEAHPVLVTLGDDTAIAVALDAERRFTRGELRFGGGAAQLPDDEGLRIAGTVAHVSVDAWRRIFDGKGASAATGGVPGVRHLDLRAGVAEAFGRRFHDLTVNAQVAQGAWGLRLSGRELAGTLRIPQDPTAPWTADFEYLHLARADADAGLNGDVVDPRQLPALRVRSERFVWDGAELGRMQLDAVPRPAGLRLERLELDSPIMHVNARGDWVRVDDVQYSSFNIDLDAADFGKAIAGFGYADSFRGGKADAVISARWDGPPTAFALEKLHGSMNIAIADGRLLDVEPGAGRVFGLISLQALPRRLTLDFSDFFGKGFSFDRINGTFEVKDGIARTDDLVMTGPAARVEARGDVDLARRLYDQTVVVTPSVSSGLPLAGIVAGGVPMAAALLLMERVFKSDIDRIARLRYRVSGPWHDPRIERLQDSDQSGKR